MAKNVHKTLHAIIEKQGGMSAPAAEEYTHTLVEAHCYHRNVY